jgi:hypothetical protein
MKLVAAAPTLTDQIKRQFVLGDIGQSDQGFIDWCMAFHHGQNEPPPLQFNKERYRGKKHPEILFAKDVFTFIHQNFYFYDIGKEAAGGAKAAYKWLPTTPAEVVKGDVGSSGTINNLFVAVLRGNQIPARCLTGVWLWSNDGNWTAQGIQRGATEGETLSWDFQKHTVSEFFVDGIGWVPADATPMRISSDNDPSIRRGRAKLGKAGWDKQLQMSCLANFGNDSGLLFLNSGEGYEFGRPLMGTCAVGCTPQATQAVGCREFVVNDLKVYDGDTPADISAEELPASATIPENPNRVFDDGTR